LIHQVERDVRKKVSVRLSKLKSAPHELTKLLAKDEIEIARPVLQHSPVLDDLDLIDVIETETVDHRQAIATRPDVSPDVCSALAKAKEPKVIQSLLANLGAAIPRAVFSDLVALSEAVEPLQRPLIARHDMPKDLAHRMFWFVSAAMRRAILEAFAVDPKELDSVLAEVLAEHDAEQAKKTKHGKASNWTMGEVNALIAKAKAGEISGFIMMLAELVGVDVAVAARIAADTGGEPLAIACKALGADRSQFTTLFLQLDYKRFGQARPVSHLQQASRIYDLMPKEKAMAQLTLWNAQGVKTAA
jgi:uncharacterized protein (DUF2336 family)